MISLGQERGFKCALRRRRIIELKAVTPRVMLTMLSARKGAVLSRLTIGSFRPSHVGGGGKRY